MVLWAPYGLNLRFVYNGLNYSTRTRDAQAQKGARVIPGRRTLAERLGYLSADEAAALMGITRRQLLSRVSRGEPPQPAHGPPSGRYLFRPEEVGRAVSKDIGGRRDGPSRRNVEVPSRPLSLMEAGRILGVGPATLRHQLRKGVISGSKVGRDWMLSPDEVDRYRREHQHLGAPRSAAPELAILLVRALAELGRASEAALVGDLDAVRRILGATQDELHQITALVEALERRDALE